MLLRAISVKAPLPYLMLEGKKDVEIRGFRVKPNTKLLINCSKKPFDKNFLLPAYRERQPGQGGVSVCLVTIKECIPITDENKFEMAIRACVTPGSVKYAKPYAWIISEVVEVERLPASGQLSVYLYDFKGSINNG